MNRLWGSGGAYQAWADHLERWARGEQPAPGQLPALAPADFSAETWQRLAARLTAALSAGLQTWADALTAAVSADNDDEFAVGRALAQARHGLRGIRALAGHPGLPGDMRARLIQLVDGQVAKAQQDLERMVRRDAAAATDPHRIEARLRTLRDNSLTAVLAEDAGRQPDAAGWDYDPAAPPRRRVVRP
ncbi:hypothetical protein [Streptomyces johnsoniae]|uniref:HPt domain-containing protein n=1 Tax=Streptomyces johnsoniae TaxID=3075532 RepID=A0ABU2S932_9ACTN|nr:hypothetical protein [Streptomyces sp. DSM 41886]MDT0445438.1 hypothetical protein [Streptomyces sp. DSM 41886]